MHDYQISHLTQAAVAIPVLLGEVGEPRILLTRRPMTMSHHPGELCFPGGKRASDDPSLYATALRELQEELGIAADAILGYRSEVGCTTTSGFHIEPFVVALAGDVALRPDAREVAECCEIPLSELLTFTRYRIEKFSHSRDDFSFSFASEFGAVRGATCALLLNLVRSLSRAGGVTVYLSELVANG
ncbi:MAG: CoA pyrophosphatase [Haliangiales bacterium]